MKRAEEVSPQKENNYWLPGIMGREEWSDENILEDSGDGRMTLNILKSTEFYTLNGWYELYLKKVLFQKHPFPHPVHKQS